MKKAKEILRSYYRWIWGRNNPDTNQALVELHEALKERINKIVLFHIFEDIIDAHIEAYKNKKITEGCYLDKPIDKGITQTHAILAEFFGEKGEKMDNSNSAKPETKSFNNIGETKLCPFMSRPEGDRLCEGKRCMAWGKWYIVNREEAQ